MSARESKRYLHRRLGGKIIKRRPLKVQESSEMGIFHIHSSQPTSKNGQR